MDLSGSQFSCFFSKTGGWIVHAEHILVQLVARLHYAWLWTFKLMAKWQTDINLPCRLKDSAPGQVATAANSILLSWGRVGHFIPQLQSITWLLGHTISVMVHGPHFQPGPYQERIEHHKGSFVPYKDILPDSLRSIKVCSCCRRPGKMHYHCYWATAATG